MSSCKAGRFFVVFLAVAVWMLIGCEMAIDEPSTGRVVGKAIFLNNDSHEDIIVSLEILEKGITRNVSRAINGITSDADSRSLTAQTKTKANGEFSFESVPEGSYTLYASSKDSKERAVHTSLQVVKGRTVTAPDLQLTAVGDIKGRIVLDGTETGNIGFIVFIAGTSYMAITNDNGDFTISSVPSGDEYVIIIMRGTDTYQWSETIEVEAGKITQLGAKNLVSEDFPGIVSIIWKGELTSAPTNPQLNWAYYNSTDKISYMYDGSAWQVLARDGMVGPTGPTGPTGEPGVSIIWQGELTDHPGDPELNWAYYNLTEGKSYIYDGESWQVLAQDGNDGMDGEDGKTAVWIKYDSNQGESGTVPDIEYLYAGDSTTIKNNTGNLSRTGYIFSGWNTEADGTGTNYSVETVAVIEASSTLYAKWNPLSMTVTFDMQGGSPAPNPDPEYDPTSKIVFYNQEYGMLPLVGRSGYTFEGWYTDTGSKIDSTTTVTALANHTLYAKYSANSYTVYFDSQGGTTDPNEISVTFGQTYGTLPTVEREGYNFLGWNKASTGTGMMVLIDTTVAEYCDHTLYAIWKGESYGVILDKQEGSGGSDAVTATFGSMMPSATKPSKTNYIFKGYFDEKNGHGKQYYSESMTSTCEWDKSTPSTLYAWWVFDTFIGPAGGLVFYDNPNYSDDGWRYLEAASSDISLDGSNYDYIFGFFRYQPTADNVYVGTNAEIGTGKANTTSLIDKMKFSAYVSSSTDNVTTTPNYAAMLCNTYDQGIATDWFLPSKDELDLMYEHLKRQGLGGFSDTKYWTSTEYTAGGAWNQHFRYGIQEFGARGIDGRVRPIRAY
ncbi:InlB B-repeat-containing protein [uncultured Sphaerochaeta sp.]|uniref:InlB B-repeat-containing protein n=1 Tax=uncultured Sphaerochaeta sp. TaxID=886478 RepID=UPI0029CA815E|nr:InlB B-repeat-containing protein [uncultured Sphaerochaeta sp.]